MRRIYKNGIMVIMGNTKIDFLSEFNLLQRFPFPFLVNDIKLWQTKLFGGQFTNYIWGLPYIIR